MSFEILHFRGAEKILKSKSMGREVQLTMQYLDDVLYGSFYRRELLRQALEEMDWRNREHLNILDGRRYNYKGFRKRVAMDGSFASYEYIQDALFRLQIGFDKGKIDMGVVLVTAERSEKSKLGSTKDLVLQEIEMLYPTISLPVTIALFDLGKRGLFADDKAISKDEMPVKKVDLVANVDSGIPEEERQISVDDKVTHLDQEKQVGRKRKSRSKVKAIVIPQDPEASQIAVNQ
ncbi:MAG: hypothetical protein WC405_09120 [Syntrophales bacterium]